MPAGDLVFDSTVNPREQEASMLQEQVAAQIQTSLNGSFSSTSSGVDCVNAVAEDLKDVSINIDVVRVDWHGQVQTCVDARSFHAFLKVGRDFSSWVIGRIKTLGLIEGRDYSFSREIATQASGAKHKVCYMLTLDTAKRMAMIQRGERGAQARNYFLECEKRLISMMVAPDMGQDQSGYADLDAINTKVPGLVESVQSEVIARFVRQILDFPHLSRKVDIAAIIDLEVNAYLDARAKSSAKLAAPGMASVEPSVSQTLSDPVQPFAVQAIESEPDPDPVDQIDEITRRSGSNIRQFRPRDRNGNVIESHIEASGCSSISFVAQNILKMKRMDLFTLLRHLGWLKASRDVGKDQDHIGHLGYSDGYMVNKTVVIKSSSASGQRTVLQPMVTPKGRDHLKTILSRAQRTA